jgi:hypothetical protein
MALPIPEDAPVIIAVALSNILIFSAIAKSPLVVFS